MKLPFYAQQDCQTCEGRGGVLTEHGFKRCDCFREAAYAHILRQSGLPSRFSDFKVRDYQPQTKDQQDALDNIIAWVQRWEEYKDGGGFALVGSPGTGKTALLCAAARAVAKKYLASIRFWDARDWVSAYKAAYNNREALDDLYDQIDDSQVICLDDIGSEYVTDFTKEAIGAFVNHCYEEQKVLLVTSNIPLDKLAPTFLDVRTVDRLWELCMVFVTTGPSKRKVRKDK